jgi:cell division protein FtsW (lipid II flippase)
MKKMHPLLQEYVDYVSGRVKARELREDIKEEIAGHLEELMEYKCAQGWSDDAAAEWAVDQMGSSESVVKGLNRVHKPRIPWALLSCLLVLLAVALVIMYAVQLSYAAGSHLMAAGNLFANQAIYMAVGLAALFVISRFNYRLILRMWKILYGGTVAFLIAGIFFEPRINGLPGFLHLGPLSWVNFLEVSLFTFIVSAAGFLYQRKVGALQHLFLFTAVPLFLYASAPSFAAVLQYAVSYVLLLCFSRCGLKWVIPHTVSSIFVLVVFLFSAYGGDRLTAFLFPYKDQNGAGYNYVQIDEAIRSAGWWGHGFASVTERLPFIHSDNVFTYIIYSLGWFAGALVLFTVVIFLLQLAKAALSVQDSYGKMLIFGLGAMFAVKFTWSIGMSLGLLPISAVPLPFISYGGSGILAQLAALGIIYSVYRQKDMVRAS